MLIRIIGCSAFILWSLVTVAQDNVGVSGYILDQENNALVGATVLLNPGGKGVATNQEGYFRFKNVEKGVYTLEISYLGFETIKQTLNLKSNIEINEQLVPSLMNLQEVVVSDHYVENRKKDEVYSIEIVNDSYIKQNLGGSLMNSLERLPGISTIQIGSGQSKPVIRGLGFNRVLVVDNNLKHEAQQWGADHGLEIDQYAVDNAEIVKGPASMMFGSDAIGGVISLKNREVPTQNGIGATVDLTGKTNNDFLGASISVYGRKDQLFADFRTSVSEYGDYKVPTDSIDIYSFRADLNDNFLRNTAGYDRSLHFSLGYIHDRFQNRIIVSNINSKSGYFANAHGLIPRIVDKELQDRSTRDIQYPFQSYNHFKVTNSFNYKSANGKVSLNVDLGFQNNFREEYSRFVAHGDMPPVFPDTLPFPESLERQFDKNVFLASVKTSVWVDEKTTLHIGMNGDSHRNKIDGRGFIIPAYQQRNFGTFAFAKRDLSDISMIQLGVRYDMGQINTEPYNDWFSTTIDNEVGTSELFLPRAIHLERTFSNVSWSMGYNYHPRNWIYTFNIGKSFRMPIAKELAANGVNYHRFSFEVGNPELDPEVAYQADLGIEYRSQKWAFGFSPFYNYFSNYIYLNPTPNHDRLYGAGNQIFNYTQSRVVRYGGEFHLHYELMENLQVGVIGEYVYQLQLSGDKEGFTLPFSPPYSSIINLKYQKNKINFLTNPYIRVDYKMVAKQDRIVPPEEITLGYSAINLGLGSEIKINNQRILVSFQVQNLLNDKFFNHTSFYRLINVPEPGRNFILNLTIPFFNNLKSNEDEN